MAHAPQNAVRQSRETPTVTACVRRFCLDCLGATSGRSAYDCQSRTCPLYQSSPFRRGGRRRATKGLVVAYCRHCQPEDRTDCAGPYTCPDGTLAQPECALFAWRPWQPGGQPKARRVSDPERRRLAKVGRSSRFRNLRQ
jgi:hypothetical protein